MSERVFKSASEISQFAEERHGTLAQESRSLNAWTEAWEQTFEELQDIPCASEDVEITKYRKMINIAFTVEGARGAHLLKSIPASETSKAAFETTFGDGSTYYHKAITQGDPAMLSALVGRMKTKSFNVSPGFINTQNRDGNTPLHDVCNLSYHGGMGPTKPLETRQELARILVEEAHIKTRLQNKSGETALGVLNSGIELCEEGKTKYASRSYGETDERFNAIIEDSTAMRDTLRNKLKSGPVNAADRDEQPERTEDAPTAEVVNLDAFRRDRNKGGGGRDR